MNRFVAVISLTLTTAIPASAQFKDAPLPPRVAAMKMTLPEGFKATLFAGEPDLVQPIAFCFDDRGRLWVAECLSYPNWEADPKKGKDRIVIFEEGPDGAHSKRTVFADNIQNISGINYGFGGVWVCSTPNLIFIPIKEVEEKKGEAGKGDAGKSVGWVERTREAHHAVASAGGPREYARPTLQKDKAPQTKTVPAGPPQIVLDGWSLKAGHNVFNSLTWGPDGWLYGCSGILNNSKVGAPGTPDKDRVPINCGVWRYHPTKKKFEAVAHGTTNPWGLDFDEHGEMFVTNCVIDHLWHIVPGGHYQRMFGNDFNPHLYKLMPSICDHIHWGGGSWTSSRRPSVDDSLRESKGTRGASAPPWKIHSEAGGGHAHSGCMIYLGDNWPARYRNGVFMCNIHGNRINHDILERNGSTYVARHAKDFMLANDPWFRGLALHYGPDGGVYVADWTDTGECHNYKEVDRTNGRIYKITYGDVKPWKGDLAKLSDLELAKLQVSKNEWMVRHARRLLQERATDHKITADITRYLGKGALYNFPFPNRLRAMWALNATQSIHENQLMQWLDDPEPRVRAWAVRLSMEEGVAQNVKSRNKELSEKIRSMARSDSSALVRLNIASNMQRLPNSGDPLQLRLEILENLLEHAEDANDPYLPYMYWHALEPTSYLENVEYPSLRCPIPLLREYTARRLTEIASQPVLNRMLDTLVCDEPAIHRDVLRGVQQGYAGRRQVPMPKSWKDAYPILIESPLPEVRERALALAVQFGDERAFKLLRKIVPDRGQPVRQREDALKTLLFQQKPDLVPILHDLLGDESLRGPAIRGLAAFDDAKTPKLLIDAYARWNADEKGDAIQTLTSRGGYALALLDAIDAKAIPRGDINSYTIRQLQTLKHPDLPAKIAKVWGEVRPASTDKAKLMAKYKAELKPEVLKKANLANGRVLYTKSCANCHRLFGEGSDLGPDLTGSRRTNLDYVLENVLDPSAIVPREYQVSVIETKGGRIVSGMIRKETDAAITVQTPNEQIVIPTADIASRTLTKVSMMPDGIFEPMRLEEVRDLVAYLASPVQVPLKK